jgi:NAD(P)-dependent dehydrogenase (short-subunit alcohol dehydrogenase family)
MPSVARYDFSGRVAVVTGGANGIGACVASRLAEAGASLSIWDLSPPVGEGGARQALGVDVADVAACRAAAEAAMARFGRIDVLVHCAGYAGETVRIEDTAPEEWRRIIDVNLFGSYSVCRAVVPHMRAAGYGRIVNLASLAGKEGTPNASAYSAAKAGVIALTKSLGKELAGSGVLANVIAPAAVRTGMLAQMSEAHVATMIGKSPLGRLGTAEEIAELALWLGSDSCTFSTGAVFDASGGRATY